MAFTSSKISYVSNFGNIRVIGFLLGEKDMAASNLGSNLEIFMWSGISGSGVHFKSKEKFESIMSIGSSDIKLNC